MRELFRKRVEILGHPYIFILEKFSPQNIVDNIVWDYVYGNFKEAQ